MSFLLFLLFRKTVSAFCYAVKVYIPKLYSKIQPSQSKYSVEVFSGDGAPHLTYKELSGHGKGTRMEIFETCCVAKTCTLVVALLHLFARACPAERNKTGRESYLMAVT